MNAHRLYQGIAANYSPLRCWRFGGVQFAQPAGGRRP